MEISVCSANHARKTFRNKGSPKREKRGFVLRRFESADLAVRQLAEKEEHREMFKVKKKKTVFFGGPVRFEGIRNLRKTVNTKDELSVSFEFK